MNLLNCRLQVFACLLLASLHVNGQVYPIPLKDNKPAFKADTLYYPFYAGVQMIEIDYEAAWMAEVIWHEMRQPRALSWSSLIPEPPPNVYLFRDSNGYIIRAFNSKASIARLNADFRSVPLYPLEKKRAKDPPCHLCHRVPGGEAAHFYPMQRKKKEGFYFVYDNYKTNESPKPLSRNRPEPVGMIDSLGNIVFPVIYQYIEKFGPNFLVKKNNYFGILDQAGHTILPAVYEAANTRNEQLIVFTKDKKISCIYDVKNRTIQPLHDYDWIDENQLDDFEADKKGGLVQVRKNGKTGLINKHHMEVVPPIYDYASPVFREGLLLVNINKKWGFLDTKGKVAIPCIYEDASDFNEGYAAVIRNGTKTCINKKGEEISVCNNTLNAWEKDDELGGRGTYIKGRQVLKRRQLHGIADNNGKLLAPLIYESIYGIRINGRDIHYHQEFYKVRKQGKWGVIDKNGNETLTCEYDNIQDYIGETGLIAVEKNDLHGMLDMDFKWVVPCRYEGLSTVKQKSKIWFRENGLWGMMDMALQIIIPAQYEENGWIYDGRIRVSKGKRYGIIDTTGKTIIPVSYESLGDKFHNGLIIAMKGKKWGALDTNHVTVIPFIYDEIRNFSKQITGVKKGTKFGFIDRNNKTITDYQYDFIGHGWYMDGLTEVRRDGKIGYVNEQAMEVIPCIYDEENGFNPRLGHHMRKGREWKYVK